MKRLLCAPAVSLLLLVACSNEVEPPLSVSRLMVYAPVPGSDSGVAYLTFRNTGDRDIAIHGASSPQFRRIEMHETSINDEGVSTMRPVSSLRVPAGGEVRLAQGGTHFMLMQPDANVVPGGTVALQIRHSEGLLIVDALLQSRFPTDK